MATHWDERVRWEAAPSLCPSEIRTAVGSVRVRQGQFFDGAAAGVDVIELDSGATRVVVLPTRGMGIWKLESSGARFGWQSPVAGPVHPQWVPTWDPSGVGWLEGFD